MAKATSESDLRQQLQLKRAVLEFLKQNGRTNYQLLHTHFDQGSGNLQPVLQDLTQSQYIRIGEDDMTALTQAGLQLLYDSGYWR